MKRTGRILFLKKRLMASRKDNFHTIHPEKRKKGLANKKAGKPLLDLRLYFSYDLPKPLWYLQSFTDSLLELLQQKRLRCPGYTHIYIAIGETRKEAIEEAYEPESWHRYGIAVLPLKKIMSAPENKKEALFFKAVSDGLLDVAKRDGLDMKIIREALQQAKKEGVIRETTINQKENAKYRFRISSIPVKGKAKSDIYFSLFDKTEEKEYKWRFGRMYALETSWWFFSVTLTNKEIRTKPKANMELVLIGKKNRLKLSIEKIKKGTDRITMAKTKVTPPAWLVRLNKL
jgi:hypothetical protein